jgi:polyferredoxin
MRTPFLLDVIRDRNTLYRELPGDLIENTYTLKLINQSNDERRFRLDVSGIDGLKLDGAGDDVVVAGGDVVSLPVRVRANRRDSHGIAAIEFTATAVDDDGVTVSEDSRFIGPAQ